MVMPVTIPNVHRHHEPRRCGGLGLKREARLVVAVRLARVVKRRP
jgi:hypothetical protein